MTGGGPSISIAMPFYNCRGTLAQAVRSIRLQSLPEWELLLIDDGSTDGSLDLARSFGDRRLRVLSDGEHKGLSARLNQAIQLAEGQYLARMDADDIAYPRRFELQLEYTQHHPDVDLVGARSLVFTSDGRVLGKRESPESHEAICARPWSGFRLGHPTYFGRLEWFKRYGYRVDALRCEDQDLLLRSYRYSRLANVPSVLLGYREDVLKLRGMALGRFCYVRSLLHESFARRKPSPAIRGLVEHALKLGIDCLAVSSGLDHRILRQRACPASVAEVNDWLAVWQLVNGGGVIPESVPCD